MQRGKGIWTCSGTVLRNISKGGQRYLLELVDRGPPFLIMRRRDKFDHPIRVRTFLELHEVAIVKIYFIWKGGLAVHVA